MSDLAICVDYLSHHYSERQALREVSFEIKNGEIFVFLGPNGGGKTTLFRLISTLIPLQSGKVSILGNELQTNKKLIRSSIGVVFQAPSLDRKLTVAENMRCQGALYGLTGKQLEQRQGELLDQLGLSERAGDRVETLSGGLKRRVELAKSMIHGPRLLLMDEPSTGLDPGARIDLWDYLTRLVEQERVTVVLTSHLLEEADRADRIAILNEGVVVAMDTPDALRATVGGDSITIKTDDPEGLAVLLNDRFDIAATVMDGQARLEQANGHVWITKLVEAFPSQINSITLGKPTLEDVFIAKTGHRFWQNN